MKKCPSCGLTVEPTPENWVRNRSRGDGWTAQCKKCVAAAEKARRQRNKVKNTPPPQNVVAPVQFAEKVIHDRVEADAAKRVEQIQEFDIDVMEPDPPPPSTKESLRLVKLESELRSSRARVRELEGLVLSGDEVRAVAGSLGAPNVTSQPEWLAGASSPASVHGTAVLFLSDIHYGEVVSPQQVGGFNEYDQEIADESIRNTFRSAVRLLKGFMASPKYDGVVCPLGGDLLSGNIHEELVETNAAPIQVLMLALESVLIEGLGGLADEFGKVHVPCVTGNHGRMHKKPRAKNRAFENYEWMIYQRLAAYFKNDARLTFDIPEGSDTFFKVYGTRFGLTHGDQFRGGDGIGGIMVPIMRGASKKQVREQSIGGGFDTLMMGHWHQYIHTQQLVINGSIKGMDEWSYQMNFPSQKPEQACFIVHKDLGVTFRMPVQCRHGMRRAA